MNDLISACKEGDLEKVKVMVESKVDITVENNEALRFASINGHLEIVKFLVTGDLAVRGELLRGDPGELAWRAEPPRGDFEPGPGNKADVTANNNEAIKNSDQYVYSEIVSFLLENKADIGVLDWETETALFVGRKLFLLPGFTKLNFLIFYKIRKCFQLVEKVILKK